VVDSPAFRREDTQHSRRTILTCSRRDVHANGADPASLEAERTSNLTRQKERRMGGVRRSPTGVAACLLAMLLLTPSSPFAQSQAINGTIEGTIRDTSGAVLPGVTVVLFHLETGATRTVVTNEQGVYRAPLLPLGTYRITAEIQGFKKYDQSGISVNAGSTVVINVGLEVGTLEEVVSVTADSPVVDLGKIDVGRNLNEREIKNLPLVSRNPYNFALLEPGVTGFENEEFGVPRFSVNGQMTRIHYQIDGNNNTQKDRAGLRMLPMSEVMIREVQVVSSGYAPEFGQTTGMVYNAVTPSGTNALRGDIGYRFRTKDFSAWPFYVAPATKANPANKPDNSLSVLTGTVGGPLVRNKVFHYFGVERTYQDLDRVVTIDPAEAQQIGLDPQPAAAPSYRSVFFFIGKVDWQIGAANRLSVRSNTFRNDNPYQSGGGLTAIERGNDFADVMYSAAAQLVSTLGKNKLNELRVQVAQRHTRQFSHDPSSDPISVNISGVANFGRYTGDGMDFVQRNVQFIDNFTYMRGAHSFKTGFDVQFVDDHRAVPLPATYTFPTIQAYLDATNGVNPRSYTTFAQTIGNPFFDMNNALFSTFVQDDWKITPDIKVLYGARYDYYMYPEGIPGAPYNSTFARDKNNVAPRAGVAWTLNPDTVVRASTGIMYDQPLLAIVENAYSASGLPNRTTNVSLNPASPNAPNFPNTLAGLPPNTVQVSSTIQGMAPDFVNARTWQNSVTLERGLGLNYSMSVGYRYTRGYDLPVITDVNLVGITPVRRLEDGRGVYSASVNASTRVDPRYNRVRLVQAVGDSWYHGMTLQLTKRFSSGVQYNLNYTFAKGEDTAPLGGSTLAVQGDAVRSDPQDLQRDKGPNQLDIRHTLNGSIVAVSSVKRFNPLVNAILSDNQVGVLIQINSGVPDSIAGNLDLNLDGNGGDRPLFVERNSMYVPPRWNVDLRYSRFFDLWGDQRIEVQGEFKNVFNIPQPSGVNNTITVNANGYPVDAANRQLPLDSISLNGDDYDPTGGREQRKFQLGFKFYF
jgi:hypothetical protein